MAEQEQRVPRASGDEPGVSPLHLLECNVFPARAGMSLALGNIKAYKHSVPRASGDEPSST